MIEVLFGESSAGSMKVAKNNKVIQTISNGPTTFIGETGKVEQIKTVGFSDKRKVIEWIPGDAKEVICLGFMLDIGDIKQPVESQNRKELIYSLFNQGQWGRFSEVEKELEETADVYVQELERLKAYMDAGKPIRIWYSNSPQDMCGYYFICNWMKDYENKIYVVKMPEYRINEKYIISYTNWGEVAAEEFSYFLRYEKELSMRERKMNANLWTELIEANAPLRAVVNGKLIGVPEDFYDFLILDRITERPEKQARIIGDILGHNPISVGDWWYAARIEKFIHQGKIIVTEDSENKYARMICLKAGNTR